MINQKEKKEIMLKNVHNFKTKLVKNNKKQNKKLDIREKMTSKMETNLK